MIDKISTYDLPTTKTVPDGYDMKSVPDASDANIAYMIERHNDLVTVINSLIDTTAILKNY